MYSMSKALPAVSFVPVGLVSAKPYAITTWQFLGFPPTGLVPELLPRRRKIKPREYGLIQVIAGIIGAPLILPAAMLESIAEAVREQAQYEADLESGLRARLLEIRMRYEIGEISEQEYKAQEAELERRLKEVEEKGESKGKGKIKFTGKSQS